jgi:hypothetical protein
MKSLPIIYLGKRSVIRFRLSTLSHNTVTTLAQRSHKVGRELEKVICREYNATISTQEKKYLKFCSLTFTKFFQEAFHRDRLMKGPAKDEWQQGASERPTRWRGEKGEERDHQCLTLLQLIQYWTPERTSWVQNILKVSLPDGTIVTIPDTTTAQIQEMALS